MLLCRKRLFLKAPLLPQFSHFLHSTVKLQTCNYQVRFSRNPQQSPREPQQIQNNAFSEKLNKDFDTFIAQREYTKAMDTLKQMDEKNIIPAASTYSHVLSKLAKQRNLEMGKKIHAHMRKTKHSSTSSKNALLNLYSKCGDLASATEVFNSMVADKTADLITHNAWMTAMGHNRNPKQALEMYEKMQQEPSLSAAPTSLHIIMKVLNENRMYKEAVQTYEKYSGMVVPDVHIFTQLCAGYIGQQQMDKAVDVLTLMKDARIELYHGKVCVLLIEGLQKYPNPALLHKVSEMLRPYQQKLQSTIFYLLNQGKVEDAAHAYNLYKQVVPISEVCFASIVNALSVVQRYDDVIQFFENRKGGTTYSNYELAIAYFAKERARDAILTLQQLDIQKVKPKPELFFRLLKVAAKSVNMPKELLAQVTESHDPLKVFVGALLKTLQTE